MVTQGEKYEMGSPGLELPLKTSGKTPVSDSDGAQSGALLSDSVPTDPLLTQLIDAWADLPEAIRIGIAALVASTEQVKP